MEEQPIIDSVPDTTAQEQQADTVYQQGLLDFQNGRWDQAAASFEEVLRLRPDHAAARAFLDETRVKASLEEARPKPKRVRFGGRLKYIALALAVLALLVGAAYAGRYAYNTWIRPDETKTQEQRQKAQQVTRAYQLLANRDYANAEEAFNELLAADPGNTAWTQALEQIEQRKALDADYASAEAAVIAKDWARAETILRSVIAVDPRYGDAQVKLLYVQQQATLSAAFARAEAAYKTGKWAEACRAYEDLIDLSVDYEKATVSAHLFDGYYKQAIELVEGSKGSLEALVEAKALFQKALSLQPQNEVVSLQVSLADKYLEAQRLIVLGNRPAAVLLLQYVVDKQPDYAGGSAAILLHGTESTPAPPPTPVAPLPTSIAPLPTAVTPAPAPEPSEPVPHPTQITPGGTVEPENEFQRQFVQLMRDGDNAASVGDWATAEAHYRSAALVGVHGGQDTARLLFAAFVKQGTAAAKAGNLAAGTGLIKTGLDIITRSATAIPVELYEDSIRQGDFKVAQSDYLSALSHYDQAVTILAGKCNCGLENWSVVP
ncbi:MAG: Tetratricopeptide repeat protein [Chloroflexi bacterium ADurb.Bin180]|nr:MAG: Tetratricopeptide repeat protein [Chloroflexi bacterium ADurb.Bin180]HNR95747.1 tetratricopeptide repeat protein [Anaerolineae bacterium]